MRDIEAHQSANRSYIEEGIRLLELAQSAHELFESEPPAKKREIVDSVLSNCQWKEGRLIGEFRQPFDLIAAAAQSDRQLSSGSGGGNGDFGNWRRERDSNPR